jgi:hypothetical protein
MEEITKRRLDGHDREIQEIKIDIKDINKSVIQIEKTDIRIEIDVKSILDTYKIIRNAVILFVVINVLTMIWAFSGKL